MFVAQITFKTIKGETTDEQRDEIDFLLGCLRKDGRILGEDLLIYQNGKSFVSVVPIPAKDAFENFGQSKYIFQSLAKLSELNLSAFSAEILGQDFSVNAACECTDSTAFILFTNYISIQSPIRCFSCFMPVPLYRLPRFSSGEFYEIFSWQSNYKSCDTLQMNCTVGEKFALRQIFDLTSSLSKEGLDICVELHRLTNKNCYYYLYKYRGKSLKKERERKCPKCGDEWLLDESLHKLFDFQCDKCHLLSNIAFDLR